MPSKKRPRKNKGQQENTQQVTQQKKVRRTYRTGVRYLLVDHPDNINQETSASFQEMMIRAVGAYVLKEVPEVSYGRITSILQAVRELLAGTHPLPTNAQAQGHAMGRFNYLWRGVICQEKLRTQRQRTKKDRLKRPIKRQRTKKQRIDWPKEQTLKQEDYQVLATGLMKRVQKQAAVKRLTELYRQATQDTLHYTDPVLELFANGQFQAKKQESNKQTDGILQELLQDGRNYLQSVFTTLAAHAQTHLEWQTKLETDIQIFYQEHPAEWASFLLFGERRYVSLVLSQKWGLRQLFVSRWLAGVRRSLDHQLPADLWIYPHEHTDLTEQSLALYPALSVQEFAKACHLKVLELNQQMAERTAENKPTTPLKTFLRKVQSLETYATEVVRALFNSDSPLQIGRTSSKDKAVELDLVLRERVTKHSKGAKKLRPRKYRSALISVLSLAAVTQGSVLPTQVTTLLRADRCLTRPFQRLKEQIEQFDAHKHTSSTFAVHPLKGRLQPLLLKWGRKYLIERAPYTTRKKATEKSAKDQSVSTQSDEDQTDPQESVAYDITSQLKAQGYFDLRVKKCPTPFLRLPRGSTDVLKRTDLLKRPIQLKNQQIVLRVQATHKMRQILANGVQVEVLRLMPPRGPARKIDVDIVFTGPPEAFAALAHLEDECLKGPRAATSPPSYQDQLSYRPIPCQALGVDVNRVSDYVVAFSSEPAELSEPGISRTLQTMCEHFKALDQPLQALQSTIDRLIATGHFRYVPRVINQHDLLQRRRRTLLKAIYERCMVDLDSQLVLTGAQALVLEELSSISSEGTRKQLAKAIETMPSGKELYERCLHNVNVFRQKTDLQSPPVLISHLRPDGTSLRHVGCQQDPKGKLQRTGKDWDWATCDACHTYEQTHRNAAKRLVERFENHP